MKRIAYNYDVLFRNKLVQHLIHYYDELLGLKNIDKRIFYREHEEKIEAVRLVNLLQKLRMIDVENTTMLVVGSGWGGMLYAAKQIGINVCGIDVDKDAVEISRLRFLKNNMAPAPVYLAASENLPFKDNTFNLVYCFSVVEHVKNIEKTISEISRVMKQGAYGYIDTCNYNIPWEPHYKMVLPTMLGYHICKFLLRLRLRSPDYLDTLNLFKKGFLIKLLSYFGIPQIEEWDIVNHTIAKNGGIEVSFFIEKKKDPLRYFKEFDTYLGALIFKAYKLFGITNISAIIRKN